MALVTGTPLGNIDSQEEIYLEAAPKIYYQRYEANELKNPDSDGFYWSLSGTTAYPVYDLGCYTDVSMSEDLTVNAVRCDAVGDKDVVQHRNFVSVSFTLQTMFPLSALAPILKGGTDSVTNASEHTEKMGIGSINNNIFYHVYMPKVYDEQTGDYVAFTIHKAKFVDAFSISMQVGNVWQITGLQIRGFADETKPTAQQFMTVIRADASAI